nr:hypothetical protein [Sinosporangium siamense]
MTEVPPDMPAVGYLDCVGGSAAGAVGVGVGTVAADDLDIGVCPQPGGQGVGGSVGQDVDRSSRGYVDQDGSVDPALAQSEVVDAQHRRAGCGGGLGLGQGADQPDQRHPADRQGQARDQAGTGAAPEGQGDRAQCLTCRDAAAAVADR